MLRGLNSRPRFSSLRVGFDYDDDHDNDHEAPSPAKSWS